MWLSAIGRLAPYVSMERSALIFRVSAVQILGPARRHSVTWQKTWMCCNTSNLVTFEARQFVENALEQSKHRYVASTCPSNTYEHQYDIEYCCLKCKCCGYVEWWLFAKQLCLFLPLFLGISHFELAEHPLGLYKYISLPCVQRWK